MPGRRRSKRCAVEAGILNEVHPAMSWSAAIRVSFSLFMEVKTTR
jgi:hypothetical protein